MATNLYTYNQSTGGELNTNGFNDVGSAVDQDTAHVLQGNKAIRVTCDGGGGFQGVWVPLAASSFVPGATYTFSMYVYLLSDVLAPLRFYCQTDAGDIGGTVDITPTTGSFQRFSFTRTMPNPITQSLIGLRWDTGGTNQAVTIWMDELQIEQSASVGAWSAGGVSSGLAIVGGSCGIIAKPRFSPGVQRVRGVASGRAEGFIPSTFLVEFVGRDGLAPAFVGRDGIAPTFEGR